MQELKLIITMYHKAAGGSVECNFWSCPVLRMSWKKVQIYIKKGHSNKHRLYAARTIDTTYDENYKY